MVLVIIGRKRWRWPRTLNEACRWLPWCPPYLLDDVQSHYHPTMVAVPQSWLRVWSHLLGDETSDVPKPFWAILCQTFSLCPWIPQSPASNIQLPLRHVRTMIILSLHSSMGGELTTSQAEIHPPCKLRGCPLATGLWDQRPSPVQAHWVWKLEKHAWDASH